MRTLSCAVPAADLHQKQCTQAADRKGGRKDLKAYKAQACGALLSGECKVGVSLISSTHKRLAPVCLTATAISLFHFSLSGPIWLPRKTASAGFRIPWQ